MAHIHEHTHSDGTTHSHEHPHTHDSNHGHDHLDANDKAQTKALLAFMIEHNEHHAEELAALLDGLEEKAKKKLLSAIGTFEAANVELKAVLDMLD